MYKWPADGWGLVYETRVNPGSVRVNIYGHMVQERGEPRLNPYYGSGVNPALAVIAPGPRCEAS